MCNVRIFIDINKKLISHIAQKHRQQYPALCVLNVTITEMFDNGIINVNNYYESLYDI